MEIEPPDEWKFVEDKYLVEEGPMFATEENVCSTHIVYDGEECKISLFPGDTEGALIDGYEGSYDDREQCAIFGVALIKIILSGENIMVEL